jgi:hypothetical protein
LESGRLIRRLASIRWSPCVTNNYFSGGKTFSVADSVNRLSDSP